jgi:dynein intermediate chain
MIISVSTDGVMCAWTTDMLARPQEYLELAHPPPLTSTTTTALLPSKGIEELSPLSMTFSRNDSSTFFVGTEDGGIYGVNRYDRAGAKAGTDTTLRLTPHHGPVSKVELHRAGIGGDDSASEFDDLLLSTSLDWTIRLWRTRHSTLGNEAKTVSPVIEWTREDMVYDCAWSPRRPSLFTTVDGSGSLELWDLTSLDPEIPVAAVRSPGALNKVCWETGQEGRRVVTGALDGRVQVWDLGAEYGAEGFGGKEEVLGIKKFLARCEGERGGGGAGGEHRRSSSSWR